MALIPASSSKGANERNGGMSENDILVSDLRYIIEEQRKTIGQNNAKIAELEDDNTRKAETIRSQEARIRELNEQNTSLENKLELLNTYKAEKSAPETMPAEPEGKIVRKGRKERKA